MEFDGPVESWEAIWLVFKKLITDVIRDLVRHGCGARRVALEFLRADKKVVRKSIALSRPSRDPANLFNLIRCATEHVDGGDDGFLAIRLHVALAERIDAEQIALLGGERYASAIELAGLIERLCVRLGDDAIAQPRLVESHIPERAFAYHGAGSIEGGLGVPPEHLRRPPVSTGSLGRDAQATAERAGRPLQLFPDPIEIRATVSPSEDRDGRPIQFILRNEIHVLRHAVGPERISGEWWRGHDRTRDYFDAEDTAGKRFWMFRVNETNRWYVHGVFG
jgi:protein ImuB